MGVLEMQEKENRVDLFIESLFNRLSQKNPEILESISCFVSHLTKNDDLAYEFLTTRINNLVTFFSQLNDIADKDRRKFFVDSLIELFSDEITIYQNYIYRFYSLTYTMEHNEETKNFYI